MNRNQFRFLSILAIGLVGFFHACGVADKPTQSEQQPISQPSITEKKWPYQFLESKTEQTGHNNVMDLYAFSGKFDLDELKAFCLDRKQKSTAKVFYYVVIFDNAANASFPSSPFTAKFGLEENTAKHIRAIYEYNQLNGFSELEYHDKNIWENIPNREKI
ncbi:hypothetical protein DO97_15065 [Neosynechococcus sphagnicola sy1]|uniref:Lipoprotein n=1 Tax=Neosynechococcus sphagnicola sy1 TaxID=1497020 RepID=A0A098TIB7_9CYAN|nr:hypothetical protein [Neosynechococcus sphagnicola]KGF71854.1 hypothetical protein DO97_15065 [Neosynechococcus sphagnicola sy1]